MRNWLFNGVRLFRKEFLEQIAVKGIKDALTYISQFIFLLYYCFVSWEASK